MLSLFTKIVLFSILINVDNLSDKVKYSLLVANKVPNSVEAYIFFSLALGNKSVILLNKLLLTASPPNVTCVFD